MHSVGDDVFFDLWQLVASAVMCWQINHKHIYYFLLHNNMIPIFNPSLITDLLMRQVRQQSSRSMKHVKCDSHTDYKENTIPWTGILTFKVFSNIFRVSCMSLNSFENSIFLFFSPGAFLHLWRKASGERSWRCPRTLYFKGLKQLMNVTSYAQLKSTATNRHNYIILWLTRQGAAFR